MKCEKCKKGTLRQIVNVVVDAPADCHNLSKKGIRSKKVKIMGVIWDRATWYCTADGCGFIMHLGKKKEKRRPA